MAPRRPDLLEKDYSKFSKAEMAEHLDDLDAHYRAVWDTLVANGCPEPTSDDYSEFAAAVKTAVGLAGAVEDWVPVSCDVNYGVDPDFYMGPEVERIRDCGAAAVLRAYRRRKPDSYFLVTYTSGSDVEPRFGNADFNDDLYLIAIALVGQHIARGIPLADVNLEKIHRRIMMPRIPVADVGGDDPLFEVELMDETGEIEGVQVYVSDAFAHDHDEQVDALVDALNESGLVADAFRLDREVIEADHLGTDVGVLEGWIGTWLSERGIS